MFVDPNKNNKGTLQGHPDTKVAFGGREHVRRRQGKTGNLDTTDKKTNGFRAGVEDCLLSRTPRPAAGLSTHIVISSAEHRPSSC
jgi:hypothetical protein